MACLPLLSGCQHNSGSVQFDISQQQDSSGGDIKADFRRSPCRKPSPRMSFCRSASSEVGLLLMVRIVDFYRKRMQQRKAHSVLASFSKSQVPGSSFAPCTSPVSDGDCAWGRQMSSVRALIIQVVNVESLKSYLKRIPSRLTELSDHA